VSTKPLVRHAAARRDLERASDFYEDTAGREIAKRFLAAARMTFREIASRPAPAHCDMARS